MNTSMVSGARWLALLPLLLIGLVLLSAAVAMVLLLAHRRTRLLGAVLLAVGLMLLAGGAGLLYMWATFRPPVVVTDSRPLPNLPSSARQGIPLATQGPGATTTQGVVPGLSSSAGSTVGQTARLTSASSVESSVPTSNRGAPSELRPSWVDASPSATAGLSSSAGRTVEQAVRPSLPNSDRNNTHEARPAWVDASPRRDGDAYQMSITVGPYSTRLECDAQLPKALQGAVDAYVETYLGPEAAGRVRLPAEDLRAQLVKEEYEETIQASFGPMKQLHVLLQFDHKMRDRIQESRTNAIITDRLIYTGTGLGGGLLLLTIVFALLKFDQATGGARRGRLALAALLAVAAVACAVAILVVA